MTEHIDVNAIAVAWIEALVARGVTLQARGKQLVMSPKSAFAAMSNDERATLKAHKTAIVAVVRGGHYATTTPKPATAPTAHAQPEPCPYCHQPLARCADIKATRLDVWQVLHHNDPVEQQRHGDEATAEMYESLRRRARGGWR